MPTPKRTRRPRAPKRPDPLDSDFGPGLKEDPGSESPSGPIPGIACGGERCLLKPLADLLGRFTLRLSRGHLASISRAAFSGLELMKALRDFLDEEIAMTERARGGSGRGQRFTKISVE